MEVGIILQVVLPVATIAAAYGGVKVGLNGTRERVKDIDEKLDIHIKENLETHQELLQRVSVVETKVDHISIELKEKAPIERVS